MLKTQHWYKCKSVGFSLSVYLLYSHSHDFTYRVFPEHMLIKWLFTHFMEAFKGSPWFSTVLFLIQLSTLTWLDPSDHPEYKTKDTYWSTASWQVPQWPGHEWSKGIQQVYRKRLMKEEENLQLAPQSN